MLYPFEELLNTIAMTRWYSGDFFVMFSNSQCQLQAEF
jgi:hypothetical protein